VVDAYKMKNPFAQSPHYWQVVFDLPAAAVTTAENSFDDIALSVANFETDEANHIWSLEILFDVSPDMADINRRLMVLAALHNIKTPTPTLQQLVQQDWLRQVARDFPPLSIGRFYVHGAHVNEPRPGSINIQIDAGAAFGSGEHGTTGCCLEALDWLAKKRDFKNILDMGCGSGILAIAANKLWRVNVLAADIDPIAVQVTNENARINRAAGQVEAIVSDGYLNERIKRAAPYDLIISNILARPLVAFAPKLAQHLAPGGIAVLSGLLASQEAQVRTAHQAQGLTFLKRFADRGWHTLVIGKKE
jgi:ribosomal protein L11 methyltransferase